MLCDGDNEYILITKKCQQLILFFFDFFSKFFTFLCIFLYCMKIDFLILFCFVFFLLFLLFFIYFFLKPYMAADEQEYVCCRMWMNVTGYEEPCTGING